ncbi:MAG: arabinose ABC transporter permease [Firmicutes bacterium HGW-Firmicutes-11]|jgi:MFS family permease|nr:MAG: arabinose ABC transporter permease [Firmicutes bacterium HGW-Firmicutes-11]
MTEKNETTSERIFTKHFNIMLIVSLLTFTGHYMLMATLPLYANELSGSNVLAGMMITSLTISALLFRPVFGPLIDTRGRKLILVTGAVLFVVVSLSYQFAQTVLLLIMLRFVNGIGFSAHTSAAGTIISDLTPKGRLSEGIGYYGISVIMGTAIGPALGIYFARETGYSTLFLVVFIFWLVALIISLFINYEKKEPKAPDIGVRKKEKFVERTAILPSLLMFFVSLTFGAVITFLPSYGVARDIVGIGVFFTVYSITVLISRLLTGRIADRHGFRIVLVPSLIALVIAMVILAFASSLMVVLIAAVFFGIGFGTSYPISNAIIIKRCPPDRRGAATSTLLAAMDIGIGLGAFLWGFVVEVAGFTTVYLASAVCAILALLTYWYLERK